MPTPTVEVVRISNMVSTTNKTYGVKNIFSSEIFGEHLDATYNQKDAIYNNKKIEVYFDNELVIKGTIGINSHVYDCTDFATEKQDTIVRKNFPKYTSLGVILIGILLVLIYLIIRRRKLFKK